MKIIVVGGGKVGYYLTKTLLEHGYQPVLIEEQKALCTRTANELDIPVICGDGTMIDVLENAGVRQCDALIGVTGQDENNMIACQLAKNLFHVPRTIAKVNNPKNLSIMKKLGVDIPINSTENIARLLEREVDAAAIKQLMPLNQGTSSLSELQLPADYKLHGVRLSELRLPEESIIVSITRGSELVIPRGSTQILSRDKIIVICKNSVLHELSTALCLE
ncbi:MAG: TrkA family potassium uptake protein [Oscillospiraceae bacterium]|nr:TrkA family potassium uptake protein [Oscillospiraceae bacterium]